MQFLENRVPPPLVLLITLLLMRVLAGFGPGIGPAFEMDYATRLIAGVILAGLGIGIAATGVMTFRRAQTTINPLAPETASSLVSNGVFAISRNPMYLGMLLLSLGWSIYLASALSLFGLLAFVLYINRYQIVPEERALAALFGDEFARYRLQVRRWI